MILDLSVDPYDCDGELKSVKGIEGVPQGDLDQYVFEPDDPAFQRIPALHPIPAKKGPPFLVIPGRGFIRGPAWIFMANSWRR